MLHVSIGDLTRRKRDLFIFLLLKQFAKLVELICGTLRLAWLFGGGKATDKGSNDKLANVALRHSHCHVSRLACLVYDLSGCS